jgi:hypothetical protein
LRPWNDSSKSESEERKAWNFPAGSVGHDEVVPAGAVRTVDHERRAVTLGVTVAEVKATPTHEEPDAPVDWDYVDQFERGMLGGGFMWPYT